MALWAEETFKYIVRHGDAKIYSQQQYPYGIIHFAPFKSREDNISFMDEKHVISLYEFSTQAKEYYAYIGMRSSLRDDYKYETHIQITIFDVESETLLIIECAKCRLLERFRFKMYNNLKALVFKKLYDYFYMKDIDFSVSI